MTKYQYDLMAVVRYNNPEMTIEDAEKAALELYKKIKSALDENREKK